MAIDFVNRFRGLINENVSRSFLQSEEARSDHLNETDYGKPLCDQKESLPVPDDGFIAKYCTDKH